MNKSIKIAIVVIASLLALLVFIESSQPKKIDWTPTYNLKDKTPFGLFVFNEEIGNLLKNDTINKVATTAYEYFNYDSYSQQNYNENDTIAVDTTYYENETITDTSYYYKGSILSISDVYQIDEKSTLEVLNFVAHGNTAIICSTDFGQVLKDSLHFITNAEFNKEKNTTVWFANPNLGKQKYTISDGASNTFFTSIDTAKTTVIGYHNTIKKTVTNCIKVKYKKGYFILNTQPVFFTNYYLLQNNNNHQYIQKTLSYLPKGNLYWLVDRQTDNQESNSIMRYIFSQPSLYAAWLVLLFGLLIFIFFNAKRKQRIVPIIKPIANTTVDFTKTIGNLYFQEGNHQNLIDKKIVYFLEKIRSEYHIDTTNLNEVFIQKLHQKTGKNKNDIQKVVQLINYQKQSYHQSIENDLIELNNAIEKIIS